MWTEQGVDDLRHLADRARKHEGTVAHINGCISFSVLGEVEVCKVLHKAKTTKELDKNRHILRRLIMCIKFCGAFELTRNPSAYEGLINFAADLDSVLAIQLKRSEIYGASTTQNDLLDAILEVYQAEIIEEVLAADFVAFQVDYHQQKAMSIRYLVNGEVVERFWAFLSPSANDGLAEAISKELEVILNDPKHNVKVIAQSYVGASVPIKKTYPNAHVVQSYAHDVNSFLENAVRSYRQVKIFYAGLQAFSSFFSRSSVILEILDGIAETKPSWNLKSRTAITIHEHEAALKQCLEIIIDADGVDAVTLSEASGLLNNLTCPEFRYWLKFFYLLTPHVEAIFAKARKPGVESGQLINALKEFEKQMMRVRCAVDNIVVNEEHVSKKPKLDRSSIAKKMCDDIISQIKRRFEFTDHLSAANLFQHKNRQGFPENHFEAATRSYPMLDGAKLRNELAAIYERDDMRAIDGIRPLLLFIARNNLSKTLSETNKLLHIICTTPMPTNESKRRFTTLSRIKTFLKRTVSEERLNALGVLSIEKKFVQSIPDFDSKVIDVFDYKRNGCSPKKRYVFFSTINFSLDLRMKCGNVASYSNAT